MSMRDTPGVAGAAADGIDEGISAVLGFKSAGVSTMFEVPADETLSAEGVATDTGGRLDGTIGAGRIAGDGTADAEAAAAAVAQASEVAGNDDWARTPGTIAMLSAYAPTTMTRPSAGDRLSEAPALVIFFYAPLLG